MSLCLDRLFNSNLDVEAGVALKVSRAEFRQEHGALGDRGELSCLWLPSSRQILVSIFGEDDDLFLSLEMHGAKDCWPSCLCQQSHRFCLDSLHLRIEERLTC